MKQKWTRREMLKLSGAVIAGTTLAAWPASGEAMASKRKSPRRAKRVLRIAHLTDIHVQPERQAQRWLRVCLRHVHALRDKPDVIFNSGDAIMDSLAADAERTRTLWTLFKKVLDEECSLPVEHCIGNHDVWGWDKKKGASPSEPLYGKKWAMQALGLATPYRSFDRAGWHFVVLDSTHWHDEKDYTARLDEEQFEWLKADLEAVEPERPVLVLSHIPILSASVFFDGKNEKTGDWVVPGRWMHIDARRIKDLFVRHANVRVCLSGHVHLLDRVDYNGVTYLCNGAVCGRWWKGTYRDCPPGYALVNLYSDGSFDREYILYGWKGKEE